MGIPYAYRHPVRVYAYGISHTHMGKIRILDRTALNSHFKSFFTKENLSSIQTMDNHIDIADMPDIANYF